MKFSSVLSLHTGLYGCGVARFSYELAQRLGVAFGPVWGLWSDAPLLSLKWSEFQIESDKRNLRALVEEHGNVSVFWHDKGDAAITKHAKHVFYADPSLGPNGLWCPSLITPKKRPVRLFSFGMAHKLQTEHYRKVQKLLAAADQPYHLRVSVGLHEGTSLDGAEKHFDALKDIMGYQHVTILGILSDDAVSEELANADYVLAFFEKGLRANNTTVHAALDHGCRVIANCDEHTPKGLADELIRLDDLWCWDIDSRRRWYEWDNLISEMKGLCEKSRSQIA